MVNFRFENPEILWWLLLLVPILVIFVVVEVRRKARIKSIGDNAVVTRLFYGTSKLVRYLKVILFMLTYTALIFGIANPQYSMKMETVERKGVDVMIGLDISNSMLAEDIKPSRLERAKQAIFKMVDEMKNDRIGLVIFAGKSYLQTPMTTDYGAVKLMLSTINTSYISVQGTALADAIDLCSESLDNANEEGDDHGKAIIIITDGENHLGNVEEAAEKAAKSGKNIYAVGIGSVDGAPIPEYHNGRQVGYKKDKTGATVVTKLDEKTLIKIAQIGNGSYLRANTARMDLNEILDEIRNLKTSTYDTIKSADYESSFQYCIALALFFMLLLIILPNRSRGRFNLNRILKAK